MATLTANRGASLTRRQIQVHLNRDLRKIARQAPSQGRSAVVAYIKTLKGWVGAAPWRANAKPGGLGKKRSR